MSLYICSLNSGSNGNCYYVGTATDAVLIDAGISCRETEKRMKRRGLDLSTVRAIFISHEHSDHINGLATLSKKYQLPVYVTPKTQSYGRAWVEAHLVRRFESGDTVEIGGLQIKTFSKCHDAEDPHSFVVTYGKLSVGVFTDIGQPCRNLITHFRQCHAVILESNYDETMLMEGDYPQHLKKRISGGNGHLSNREALDLFRRHRPPFLTHLILAHLSKNNNRPEIVRGLFEPYASQIRLFVASREEESPLFEVRDEGNLNSTFSVPLFKGEQLSLFQEQ